MKRGSSIVVMVVGLFLALSVIAAQKQLTVDVNLTMFSARVHDESGNPVLDLTADDFEVLENGRPMAVTHFSLDTRPAGIGLLLDSSLSLASFKNDLNQTIGQLMTAMRDNDEVFLMTFAGSSELVVRPTRNRGEITKAIGKTKSTAGTRFYDAVLDGLDVLSLVSYERKALIILTDGADHHSAHTFEQLLHTARLYGYEIYIIGYAGDGSITSSEPGRTEIRNQFFQLAGATGGQVFFPASLQESFRIARQILDSLHHEYSFGFYSSHPFSESSDVCIRIRGDRGEHLSIHTSFAPAPLP